MPKTNWLEGKTNYGVWSFKMMKFFQNEGLWTYRNSWKLYDRRKDVRQKFQCYQYIN